MVLMQKPSVIDSPCGKQPEKAPRWDHTSTEGCGGGKVVSWLSWMFSGYKSIYRRKKQVGGATRGPRGWGARPPSSWFPRGVPDFDSKSSGLLSVQERSSRRFHSIWTPFGIPFLRNTKIGKKKQKLALGSRLISQSQKSYKQHINAYKTSRVDNIIA